MMEYSRVLGSKRVVIHMETLLLDKAPLLGGPERAPSQIPTLFKAQKLELSAASITVLQELYELPTGFRRERVLAEIEEIPVEVKPDGWIEPDFKKIERDDVYYAFSLGGDLYLARKSENKVRVFEAHKTEDGIIAIPIFELPL